MSELGQRVIIRDSTATTYYSQWGGMSCVAMLVTGEAGMAKDLAGCQVREWLFCEGGYLVDFDERKILLYSWDSSLLHEILPKVQEAWPGWSVACIEAGIADFQQYVCSRQLLVIPRVFAVLPAETLRSRLAIKARLYAQQTQIDAGVTFGATSAQSPWAQSNLSLTFFRSQGIAIDGICDAIRAEGFTVSQHTDSMIVIEWYPDQPVLYGTLVQTPGAANLALSCVDPQGPHLNYLKTCNAYFAIQFSNLDEALDDQRLRLLDEVHLVLISITGGVVYCNWDGSIDRDCIEP